MSFLRANAIRPPAHIQTSVMERNAADRTTGIPVFCFASCSWTRVSVRQSDHQPCLNPRSGNTIFRTSKTIQFDIPCNRDTHLATLASVWRRRRTRRRTVGKANFVPVVDRSGRSGSADGRRSCPRWSKANSYLGGQQGSSQLGSVNGICMLGSSRRRRKCHCHVSERRQRCESTDNYRLHFRSMRRGGEDLYPSSVGH